MRSLNKNFTVVDLLKFYFRYKLLFTVYFLCLFFQNQLATYNRHIDPGFPPQVSPFIFILIQQQNTVTNSVR